MADDTRITECVYAAIDAINEELPQGEKVAKNFDTQLSGPLGALDSLTLIGFISHLENQLENHFNVTLSLYDDHGLDSEVDPFSRVDLLVDYLKVLMDQRKAA